MQISRIVGWLTRIVQVGGNGWDIEVNIPIRVRFVFKTVQIDATEFGVHLNGGGSFHVAQQVYVNANRYSHKAKVAAMKKKAQAHRYKRHPVFCTCKGCK